jgi:hypothetical protein
MKALWLLALGVAGLLLVGCGSASTTRTVAVTVPAPPVPTSTTSATSPVAATAPASAEDKAAPIPHSPPDFVLEETTRSGDKLKLEGRFGLPLPASESDVDQSALGECPGVDGRELITRLDVTATIQSGLPAHVMLINFSAASVTGGLAFVTDDSEGASCSSGGNDAIGEESEEEARSPDLGTLQPHEPHSVTMWVVLGDAITPNDPHPTAATLAHQQWLIHPLEAKVDNSRAGIANAHAASGKRIVACPPPEAGAPEVGFYGGDYISLVSGTSQTINTSDPKDEPLCRE